MKGFILVSILLLIAAQVMCYQLVIIDNTKNKSNFVSEKMSVYGLSVDEVKALKSEFNGNGDGRYYSMEYSRDDHLAIVISFLANNFGYEMTSAIHRDNAKTNHIFTTYYLVKKN